MRLVEISPEVIPTLPWEKFMEKDQFLAPDYVSLDFIACASNMVFTG